MRKYNVLIFPCGSVNALEIHTALKDVVSINLYGGTSRRDHSIFVYKNYIENIPFINDPSFIETFNKILEDYKIDVVFPTHDTAALYLAEHLHEIKAKVALSGTSQAHICRYKNETYALFVTENFCPKIYISADSIDVFPVFVKPVVGEGARNTRIVNSNEEFTDQDWQHEFLVTEYLPGDELTVDCFSDRHGKVRFVGPRKRNRVFCGISVNSFTVPLTEEIQQIAEKINEKLKLRGLWFFQVKQDRAGKYKLMEISIRAASTMNLYRNLGINFPLLTVNDLMDKDVSLVVNNFYLEVDRTFINRFKADINYSVVYIDFDDTITKNGEVNPFVIMYLYTERNRGRTIKVITRHEFDFDETLNRLGISKVLFDEIIHIGWTERKYHYIQNSGNVIFIDNSFEERFEVKKHFNIPVFDVDAIECLIDWRN